MLTEISEVSRIRARLVLCVKQERKYIVLVLVLVPLPDPAQPRIDVQ